MPRSLQHHNTQFTPPSKATFTYNTASELYALDAATKVKIKSRNGGLQVQKTSLSMFRNAVYIQSSSLNASSSSAGTPTLTASSLSRHWRTRPVDLSESCS